MPCSVAQRGWKFWPFLSDSLQEVLSISNIDNTSDAFSVSLKMQAEHRLLLKFQRVPSSKSVFACTRHSFQTSLAKPKFGYPCIREVARTLSYSTKRACYYLFPASITVSVCGLQDSFLCKVSAPPQFDSMHCRDSFRTAALIP